MIPGRTKACALLAAMALLAGCSGSDQIKTVKADRFTDLIFAKEQSVPCDDFSWNMTTEEFLDRVYRPEVFDSQSEAFEEYRYSYAEETRISTFSPFVSIRLRSFPQDASVTFLFDEDKLVQAGYSWIYKETETDKIGTTLQLLTQDLNSNPNIAANEVEIPDFSNRETLDFPYRYRWSFVNEPERYVEICVGGPIRSSIPVGVTVGVSPESLVKEPGVQKTAQKAWPEEEAHSGSLIVALQEYLKEQDGG